MDDKQKAKPDDAEQSERFVKTAQQLEVDESGKAFDQALKSVIPPSPLLTTLKDRR